MAISTKVITMRQGNKVDYQASKMLAGELAVINDTEELHFSPKSGKSIRVATENDLKELENKIPSGGETSFSGSAKDVTYDDSKTQLGETNVQDAIGKLSEQKVDKTGIMLAPHTDGLIYLFVDGKPVGIGLDLSGGGIVNPDNPDEPEATPSYFNVNWSNYAITCGQNTNNYNAWAPNNLQYDSVNDAFIMLQCHANKHLYKTYSSWTLSRIYPDEPWKVDDLGLPEFNGLGALWVENGIYYVFAMNSTTAYKSSDMGATWKTFTINLSAPLWGIYKCNGVYYSGDDTNTDTYYTSTDLITWETHNFGFSESYSALMEASFCWYKDYVWAFLRTNDAELGHPVILKSVDGITWEFVSDSMLHTYRSMVNCYPYEDYIIIADIDRDNGILYYSKFDGETVETLNQWNVGSGGDDFHCPCICSDGKGTVVIEFMLHSWMFFGSWADRQQYNAENMMIIGKTDSSELCSLNFEELTVESAESYINEHYDIYGDIDLTYNESMKQLVVPEASVYSGALVNKEMNLYQKNIGSAPEHLYKGNKIVSLFNSNSPHGVYPANQNYDARTFAILNIEGKTYTHKYNDTATLPSIQLRTVEKEVGYAPSDESTYPNIDGTLDATKNLGFTKQVPLVPNQYVSMNVKPHTRVTFVKPSS